MNAQERSAGLAPPTPAASYGATLLGPGLTCFRLWAPNAARVDVVIDGGASIESMRQLPGGWFEAFVQCGAGARYLFRLDGELEVPDPASRAQESDAHGPSVVTDPNSYQWRDDHWSGRPWEETVFYEMHVGACGGFAGVADMLPSLSRLGITAIELMPIAAFPGSRNWGYDGVLQFAPEATYGTPDELKALVDTAHALGVQVFLDVVYNHFGPDGNYLNAYARTFSAMTSTRRGARRSTSGAPRSGSSSSRTRCTGSMNSISTACAWMRFMPSRNRNGCRSWPPKFAPASVPAAACTWSWSMKTMPPT
jgi:1,4-alpha-glucan branching enzyme